ncbi:AEC family transporter [Thiohalocapsa marina]|nr:AEC family transporter [Thiohalocapsa marina]
MIGHVLQVTLPVFSIAAVGYVYGRLHGREMDSANRVNLNLFVPALLFYVLSEKIPSAAQWHSVAIGTVIIVLGSGLLALPFTRLARLPKRVLLPSMMFNNSGNLGLPLAAFAFGDQVLPLAVVAFVVSTAMHFSLGIWLVSGTFHPGTLLKNPIFLATVAGILAHAFDWHLPSILLPGLKMLSEVAIPLMLVALGVRLIGFDTRHWKSGLLGALLCPLSGLLSAFVALLWLAPEPETRNVLLLFSILPPAVMNFILAERFGQSADEVASMVAMGNLASLLVIPLGLGFML